jgi:hypothetical protein
MFLDEQRCWFAPLFHRPVTGRLIVGCLAQNLAGFAIGVGQIWMQILFKVAQFWMPFNSKMLDNHLNEFVI